ncbi:hypothetical protein QL285_065057 [Trifolium repens]|jgi:hypothetical protein|nr:hypothetical protein QL285_065057 [Trifolium repens]
MRTQEVNEIMDRFKREMSKINQNKRRGERDAVSSYLQIEEVCEEKPSNKQKASAMQFSYDNICFQIFRKFYENTSRIQSYSTPLPKY